MSVYPFVVAPSAKTQHPKPSESTARAGKPEQAVKYHQAKIVHLSGLPANMAATELENFVHKMYAMSLCLFDFHHINIQGSHYSSE